MIDKHHTWVSSDVTRRAFLGGTAATAATAILAACGSSSATDTPAPKPPAASPAAAAASPAAGAASPAATTAASSAAAATKPAATTGAAGTTAPATTAAGAASPAPTAAVAAGNVKKGGVLKVGVQADPVALDPHSTSLTATNHIVEHIYGRLVTIDATLSPKPDLAESWDISPDGLVYTFKLRKGVKFHNGQTPRRSGREVLL